MSDTEQRPAPGRRRRILTVVGGGAAAAALIMGGTFVALTAAGAQTDPGTEPAPADAREAIREQAEARRKEGLGPGRRGHVGPFLLGPGGMALHGEFTTKKPDGGFQTHATQLGEVTAVSSSSITVKSEDGFTRTYAVDGDTKVRPATDEGIGGIADGETVRVMALVEGDKARALAVVDTAAVKELRGKFREDLRGGKLRMEKQDQPAA
jgi:hypothetical protein